MRPSAQAALVLTLPLLSACGSGSAADVSLESGEQKASYGIGLNIGRQLEAAEGRLDHQAFLRGVQDAMAGRDPSLPEAEIQEALQAFSAAIQEAEAQRTEQEATENSAAGEAYLEENAGRAGVVTTASGLQYEVLTAGSGPRPGPADRVRIHYEGKLVDGRVFDSSLERGEPATFSVGGVIAGFTEALQLMPVGSKYRVVIPGDLAYGPQGGRPGSIIGPNATLIFELELLAIE